jgi:hypothetical protein
MISRKLAPLPNYAWAVYGGKRAVMTRGRDQRQKLLLAAVERARACPSAEQVGWNKQGHPLSSYRPGVVLHCEGGRGFDRHARKLVKDGLLRIQRAASHSAWGGSFSVDGRDAFSRTIRYSFLVPTDKGFVEADRITNAHHAH